MTSTLDTLLSAPSAERWLSAHDDPLASIYTFSRYTIALLTRADTMLIIKSNGM